MSERLILTSSFGFLLLCALAAQSVSCKRLKSELVGLLPDSSAYEDGASGEPQDGRSASAEGLAVRVKDKISDKLAAVMQPAKQYTNMVVRHQRWVARYRAIEKLVGSGKLKPMRQMIKEEYAKLDEELMKRNCRERMQELQKPKETVAYENIVGVGSAAFTQDIREIRAQFESTDFVFDVLAKLTNRLETRLLRDTMDLNSDRSDLEVGELKTDDELEERNEYLIRQAMDRLRRIIVAKAAKIALKESARLARMAATNAAASYVARNPAADGNPMFFVQSIFLLVGSANVPLAVAYLRDVKFRTAWLALGKLSGSSSICKLSSSDKESNQ